MADHLGDQPSLVDGARIDGGHLSPIAKDGDAVGNRQDFIEMMGDIDDRHPSPREVANQLKQEFDLPGVERGGRLVEKKHGGVLAHRLGDGDLLPQREIEIAEAAGGRYRQAQTFEESLGASGHGCVVNETPAR